MWYVDFYYIIWEVNLFLNELKGFNLKVLSLFL